MRGRNKSSEEVLREQLQLVFRLVSYTMEICYPCKHGIYIAYVFEGSALINPLFPKKLSCDIFTEKSSFGIHR